MADLMSILSSNYLAVGSSTNYSKSKYVAVDPDAYKGTWTGKYGNGKSFSVQISDVQGYKAKVKYQSGGTVNYGQVLIRDSSFRIGDTKFVLASKGTAVMSTVVTDPAYGNTTVYRAYAKQQ
jgi:hypothetical protein